MHEAQVRTLEQVRQVLAGTQELQFRPAQDDKGRYGWMEAVLRRLGYRQLGRADKGAVLAYLQRLSGYSRAQVTRLVSRWTAGKPLVKNYRAPEQTTTLTRAEVTAASRDELEAACAAMRAKSRAVMEQLLDDARAAPWVAEAAFHAALDLAQAGLAALRKR